MTWGNPFNTPSPSDLSCVNSYLAVSHDFARKMPLADTDIHSLPVNRQTLLHAVPSPLLSAGLQTASQNIHLPQTSLHSQTLRPDAEILSDEVQSNPRGRVVADSEMTQVWLPERAVN